MSNEKEKINSPSKAEKDAIKASKAELDKQEKETIKIPVDNLNPADLTVMVCHNGTVFKYKRGEEYKVPLAIKKILEKSKYI